jgi:hypothetical protein
MCPSCGGRLRVWTPARTRRVNAQGGRPVPLTPDRGRCRDCGVTHVVLPAWYTPRRAYTVDVIGSALLAGARRESRHTIAQRLGLPVGTIASWLTAARSAATSLVAHAYSVASPAVREHRSAAASLGNDLAEALDGIGDAARAFAARTPTPPPRSDVAGTSGIDYLGLLATQHCRRVRQRLHIAGPDGPILGLPPWHVANLITAQHGLLRARPLTS